MPRYFFHICDGVEMPDREGVELSGEGEAIEEGLQTAQELLAQGGAIGTNRRDWYIKVEDDTGKLVRHIKFTDVLSPRDRHAGSGSPSSTR